MLEKQGILGPTTGRRPGDVSVPDWKHHNGLAIDVAVTSPLTKGGMRLVNRKYDASFVGTNYHFCAMVFETLGAVNDQGEEVLRQLFTFAAQHLGREFSSYCSRAWGRVCSIAQVIVNRIDGRPDEPEPASEWLFLMGTWTSLRVREREKEKKDQ